VNRAARGALIGGGVGALVAIAQTVRAEDDPQHVVAVQALKGAAEGALVGGVIGWALDRTAEARASGGVAAYAEVARDVLTDAVDAARPHVEQAVEQALAAAEQAVAAAEQAVEAARPRVEQAVEAALPVVEQAVEAARRRAA
jgi:hypothetical protein